MRLFKEITHSLSKQDMNAIVAATEGWSGSDIENVAREAAMAPVRECIRDATVIRRRAAKLHQCGGTASCQQDAEVERLEPEARAQIALLSSFQTLRKVTLLDFQQAIVFTLNGKQHGEQESWYDSSSDEEGD
jgi:SpoVK/Ycf46/Vps4 family AAA+-type ATPase